MKVSETVRIFEGFKYAILYFIHCDTLSEVAVSKRCFA